MIAHGSAFPVAKLALNNSVPPILMASLRMALVLFILIPFWKFNLPEKISNDYEICIYNTKITDSKLKGKVAERIKEELPKITPYFSTVKDIKIT